VIKLIPFVRGVAKCRLEAGGPKLKLPHPLSRRLFDPEIRHCRRRDARGEHADHRANTHEQAGSVGHAHTLQRVKPDDVDRQVDHVERVARRAEEHERARTHRRIDAMARRFGQAIEQARKAKPHQAFPQTKARHRDDPSGAHKHNRPSPALRRRRRAAECVERNAEQERRQNAQRPDLRGHLAEVVADPRQHRVQIVERRE
jgi:hypothetical protein